VFPCFAGSLDGVCAEFDRYLARPLKEVLFSAGGSEDALLLDRTEFTQPAMFALGVALFELVGSFGVTPDYLIGHSIGELCAAYVAGVLSLEDACALVAARGRLMGELAQAGAMTAVELSERETIESLAGFEGLCLAAVNGPRSVVVSGEGEALGRWEDSLGEGGVKVRRLRVSHAFHSSLMEPMLAGLREVAEGLSFSEPKLPIVSNVSGGLLSGGQAVSPEYWARHVRETVRFADGVRVLQQAGVTRFLELGPDGILSALTAQCLSAEAEEGALIAPCMRAHKPQQESLISFLADAHVHGVQVDWGALFAGSGARQVALPTYAFQRRRYWLASGAGAGDASALGQASAGHPLLGAAVELAGGREGLLFTGRLSLTGHSWLGDHAVMETVLLPGTGFVELALTAAERVGAHEIEELTLHTPLLLSEQQAYQVQLVLTEPDEAGGRSIEIYARAETSSSELEASEWTLHASGVLAGQQGSLSGGLRGLTESWPPPGAEQLDIGEFYERVAEAGYEYGPSFQGLRQAWRSGQEVFVEVALPEEQEGQAQGFCVHPALFDAVLHGLALGAPESDGVQVPFSFSGVRLYARGASELRVHLSMRDGVPGLVAVDSAGDSVLSVERIQLRPIDHAALSAKAPRAHDALFELDWVPLSAGEAGVGRVVLLGSAGQELDGAGIELERHCDLDALQAALERGEPAPEVVLVSAQTLTEPAGGESAGGDGGLAGAVHELTAGVLGLLQGFLAAEGLGEARLVLITRGALVVREGEAPDLLQAALPGLLRSACVEHPERLSLIDVDASEASMAVLAGALASEEPEVALREGELLVPRLAHVKATLDGVQERDHGEVSAPALQGDGTILITGGTGGLGALLARHLVERGARRLLLISRSGLEAEGARELKGSLEELGAEVKVAACDVAQGEQLKGVIAQIPKAHPLSAVIHTAGVIDDGVISSLDGERLRRVMDPKVAGALNLHELTRDMGLSEFILFSSAAGTLGSPGQGNYAAANAFLDALAAARRAEGLPGSSLAWGQWAEASGMTGQLGEADLARLERSGILALSSEQGLELFDAARRVGQPLLLPVLLDLAVLRAGARLGLLPGVMRGLVRAPTPQAAAAEGLLARSLREAPESEWEAIVLELVRGQVASVLGHASGDAVDPQRNFKDAGFDSLAAVELRNRLVQATGLKLPATLIFDHPTPTAVASCVLAKIAPHNKRGIEDPDETVIREKLASIPLARLRGAGLMQPLLELADSRHDIPVEHGNLDELDAMDAEGLVRVTFEDLSVEPQRSYS
jgi:acyl transferase domain-containing protein/acyl carrier protein